MLHSEPAGELVQELRRRFDGPLIANSGFGTVTTREEAVQLIDAAHADAVAVGRPVIANPDLVERWAGQHPENEPNAATFYAAGAEGYTESLTPKTPHPHTHTVAPPVRLVIGDVRLTLFAARFRT